ncbi:MAG: hypothetical protein JF571_00295 [Asticcacaulis sp.]|nr:hypothetical protein [Asticcacaulis sp.]
MTIFATDAEIERIASGVLDCSLPKAEWTHTAHFAAALWLLRHHSYVPALMPGLICAYNDATGTKNTDTSGYHETITQASLRAATHMLDGFPADTPLHVVLDALMASDFGRPDWLLAYWTRDRLFSPQARRGWAEPDIAPLPF